MFAPPTLRSGVYQAKVAMKRQAAERKAAHTASTSTPASSKDTSKPSYDSCTPPPCDEPSLDAESDSPRIFKFVRPAPFFKSEFMGERPLDAEMREGVAGPDAEIQLPRKLQRAPYKPVSKEAIEAVAPELTDIPYPYVVERVQENSKSWFPGLRNVNVSFDKSTVPDSYDVLVKDHASPPTHILAVKPLAQPSSSKTSQPCPVKLYPVHSMVMACHCRHLPPFAPGHCESKECDHPSEDGEHPTTESKECDRPSEDGERLTLPCRYLSLPHPETFPFSLAFLYTQNKATFLKALLPVPAPPNVVENEVDSVRGFGTRLGLIASPERILQSIYFTHMVWMNTLALGIVDDAYWECLDTAWESLLCAFAVATGQPEVMGLLP